ncbi:glycosyl hydrolase family 18 protein [Lachnoanaerobaculum umeaense]|uniref:Glycosyl hydrolase family 18 n=1 Tax=Lachnoanaerobaculum umeaense TaxID=617123 RepID=A0A385PXQ7_9FIRM|nr:glycosyl hydrolase family 18 protein [Lachnoanaerobaculum umeaense]AYA98746.1 glycosyl hydrolase family 18 [Lachnoanaerobaculum umeaense]PZW99992.1 spore germination protein YaaH [Lachnoanaerobaculum umeaense]
MKRKVIIGILIVICIIFGAIFIPREIKDIIGSTEKISEYDIYQVKDDEVALVYNYSLQKAKAIYKDGVVYIPLNWTRAIINDKFYYSDNEKLLSYALPTEIVYANFENVDNNGKPLLIENEDKAYLSIETIKVYTDIWVETYTDGDIKKIYINDKFGKYEQASIKSKTGLRVDASNWSASIENVELDNDENVVVVEQKDKWCRVLTQNGVLGYVKKNHLKNILEAERVSNFIKPDYTSISMDEKVVLGWHQVTTSAANSGMDKVVANTSGLNVISPTWFKLSDNKGNYTSIASKDYVDAAHKKGLKVWPLIDNFSTEISTLKILSSSENRKNLIANLMSDVEKYDFDGINIDFESLTQDNAPHFIQFMRELSVSCRNSGVVLSVDVPIPASYNMYYERDELAEVVDYVINMGYDEHYSGSDEGSSASINFVKNSITDSLVEVPKEKLINAVPVYTRVWTKENSKVSSSALGMSAAANWVKENNIELTWDDEVGQYTGQTTIGSARKYIWLEDERSMKLKMDAIKEEDLAGVAVWKLGLEPKEIWNVISYK